MIQWLPLPSTLSDIINEYIVSIESLFFAKPHPRNSDFSEIIAFIPGVCLGKKISLYEIWTEGIETVTGGMYKNGVYRVVGHGVGFIMYAEGTPFPSMRPKLAVIDMDAKNLTKFTYTSIGNSIHSHIQYIQQYDFNHILTLETDENQKSHVVLYNTEDKKCKIITNLNLRYQYCYLAGSILHIFETDYNYKYIARHFKICIKTGLVQVEELKLNLLVSSIFQMENKIFLVGNYDDVARNAHVYNLNNNTWQSEEIKIPVLSEHKYCKLEYIAEYLFMIGNDKYWVANLSTISQVENIIWKEYTYSNEMKTMTKMKAVSIISYCVIN